MSPSVPICGVFTALVIAHLIVILALQCFETVGRMYPTCKMCCSDNSLKFTTQFNPG